MFIGSLVLFNKMSGEGADGIDLYADVDDFGAVSMIISKGSLHM